MAFPVAQATAETAVATAATSHPITLPASVAAGDLLVLVLAKGSVAATVNAHADWTELLDENSAGGFYIAYRWATGGETTTTLVTSASTRSATIAYRISGAVNPATQAPEVGTTASGSSTTPDPPAVTPTGGAKDYLWIAALTRTGEEADDDTWATASPTNFLPNPPLQKACGVAGTNLAGIVAAASLGSTAASMNPGTFTIATGAWRAQTIAVHPGPPAASGVAVITGNGVIVAVGVKAVSGTSLITGSGTLVGTGVKATSGSAAITGGGTVAANGTHGVSGTASISASGSVSSSGAKDGVNTASITAGGNVTAIGTKTASGSALITGGGLVTATGSPSGGPPALSGTATITGGGALAASGTKSSSGTATITGGGNITAVMSLSVPSAVITEGLSFGQIAGPKTGRLMP